MAYLEGTTQQEYYTGENLGNYQFISLDDIINQFMTVYVGDEKIIRKCSKIDVGFHAQRALAELSFDTFKSIKAQEIEIPASLKMMLPHDYVNYTKLSWVDGAGIKHPLYPTKHTSNPFKILQKENKDYDFDTTVNALVKNSDFSDSSGLIQGNNPDGWGRTAFNAGAVLTVDNIEITGGELVFTHGSKTMNDFAPGPNPKAAQVYCVWQRIDLSGINEIDLSVSGTSAAAVTGVKGSGLLKFGISTKKPSGVYDQSFSDTSFVAFKLNPFHPQNQTSGINNAGNPATYSYVTPNEPASTIYNLLDENNNPSFVTFDDGLATASTKTINNVNVSGINEAYIIIISHVNYFTTQVNTLSDTSQNKIDDVSVTFDGILPNLQSGGESTAWSNYKSHNPSENNINDYQDYENNVYWPNEGERYGLDPQHAQVNGSFYIDELKGLIHFSSNISGKTVILDYISDSLGTNEEMKVHKFAEEAMYRWILHAIASGYMYTQQLIPRLKKEKIAAARQAKLRLSNIKLEEITQILRGKSKQIKH